MNFEIFTNKEFGRVRIVEESGISWFVGKDIAKVLGYTNASEMYQRVPDEDKREINPQGVENTGFIDLEITTANSINGKILLEPNPNIKRMMLINESGLYYATFGSKLPKAQEFTHWVTSEVLPTIRKYGAYIVPDVARRMIDDPEYAQYVAALVCEDKINKLLTTTATCKTDEGYCKWSRDGIMPLINKLHTYHSEITQQKLFGATYRALKEYEGFDVYAERESFIVHQIQLAVAN